MSTINVDNVSGLDTVKVNIADSQVVKVSSTQTDIKVSASRELNILKDSGDDALVLQCSAPDSSNNLRRIECAGEKFSVSTGASSGTTATQKLLVEVNGSVALGHASDPTSDSSVGVSVNTNSANDTIHTLVNNTATGTGSSTSREHQTFRRAGSQVGSISTASSATTFATSSDYRIKENVNYSFDATTDLKKLKPCKFNFKDLSSETIVGFLAHEAAEVIPNSVVGEKDATITKTDSDGKSVTEIKPQSMDHSKLVPLLVKTIQELEARITTLESK